MRRMEERTPVWEKEVVVVSLDGGEFISVTWEDLDTNQKGEFYVVQDVPIPSSDVFLLQEEPVFVQLFNWHRSVMPSC